MTEEVRKIDQRTTQLGDTVQRTTEVHDPQAVNEHQANVIERVVWYIGGVILVILGFRFILSLLGANTTNGFANFIYSISHPFVSPFFSLFSYNNIQYGESRFEVYTLVAMVFYLVITWGIAKLLTITRD